MNSAQSYERLIDHSPSKALGIYSNISMQTVQFPVTPSGKTKQWRHGFSGAKQRMRTMSLANGILHRRGHQSDDELPLISANNEMSTEIMSDATESPVRRGVTRSPFPVSPGTSSSLRRKVKTGAAGGLREAKTSVKGGTPSPKRKRSAAKEKLHALMHRVTDAVRVRSSPRLANRHAKLSAYGASFSVPHLPASNLQNEWKQYSNNPFSTIFGQNSRIQIASSSREVYIADEAEKPRPERRTKPSGGGRDKLLNVLGDDAPV